MRTCAKRALARAGALVAGTLVAASVPVPAQAGDLGTPSGIRDLYYGEVLFHFYQDQHFDALTHLLAARAAGRETH